MQEDKKNDSFSNWLDKLQQESWQLELLISGVAIFALWESLKVLPAYLPIAQEISSAAFLLGLTLNFAIVALIAGIKIFLINLVIHVLIRSLWIGALGLRYVSGDINFEELNYNKRITDHLKNKIGPFDNYIDKLENFSSILFSYTFLLFFILLSVFLYFLWAILFLYILSESLPSESLPKDSWWAIFGFGILGIYLLLGLLVTFDFVTLGLLKRVKNKTFARVYLPLYRFYSTITLSFSWRPMLFNFLDQPYTKRLFLLIIPYLIFLGFLGGFNVNTDGYYPNFIHQEQYNYLYTINQHSFNLVYYEEERNKYADADVFQKTIRQFSIPSKKIIGPIGEIFVKARSTDKWLINKSDATLLPLKDEGLTHHVLGSFNVGWNAYGDVDAEAFKQQFIKSKSILKNSILLSIDSTAIAPERISCDYYTHPDGKVPGLLCFYPLDSIAIGRHILEVGKVVANKNRQTNEIILDTTYQIIPFIYGGPN